jgi:hypothetical protein
VMRFFYDLYDKALKKQFFPIGKFKTI